MVQQKREPNPCLLKPHPGAILGLKPDDVNVRFECLQRPTVMVQLHHMLPAVQSTQVAQEYQQCSLLCPQDGVQRNMLPIHLVQFEERSGITFLKQNSPPSALEVLQQAVQGYQSWPATFPGTGSAQERTEPDVNDRNRTPKHIEIGKESIGSGFSARSSGAVS